jgi:hypothetical protein
VDNIRIGATDYLGGGSVNFFNGSIGQVRYYNTNLSAAQILQNYNATKDIYI